MLQAARFSLFSASAPRISPSRSRPADLPFELTCENAWKVHGSPGVYCGLAFERLSQQAIGSDGLGAATEKGCEVGIESDSARESPCSPPPPLFVPQSLTFLRSTLLIDPWRDTEAQSLTDGLPIADRSRESR